MRDMDIICTTGYLCARCGDEAIETAYGWRHVHFHPDCEPPLVMPWQKTAPSLA